MWIFSQLNRIEDQLNQVLIQQNKLMNLINKQGVMTMALKDDVDTLVAEVEEGTTLAGSTQTLLTQLTELIRAQGVDPATMTKIQNVIAAVAANNKALGDAIVANTPAA